MSQDRDLTMRELADLLRVSERWVRQQVAARRFPCHRRGRLVRFTPDDVAAIRNMDAQPVIADTVPAWLGASASKTPPPQPKPHTPHTPPRGTPPPSQPPRQPHRPGAPEAPSRSAVAA